MFQKIIESAKHKETWVHTLENLTLISAFEIDLIDEEIFGESRAEAVIRELLKNLSDKVMMRVYLKSEFSTESLHQSRSEDLKDLGFVSNKVFIFLEQQNELRLNPFKSLKVNSLNSSKISDLELPLWKDLGLAAKSLNKEETLDLFRFLPNEINHDFQKLDLGHSSLSLIRLCKQTEFSLNFKTLSHIKDSLPLPYMIAVSIKPIPQAQAETMLRRRSKQSETGKDMKDQRKLNEAQSDLESISLNGSRLFRFEWSCLITRTQEEDLRSDREEIKRRLKELGETYIESVGAFNSLRAIFPGEAQHYSLIEKDEVLPSYLPILTRGDSGSKKQSTNRSLAVHRLDDSLSYVDIFDPKYESFSWCIFGRPGTGKSVLVNAITRALAHDPGVKIIKIDVGGSHSRETQMLDGLEKTLSLNEPTGINPFQILKDLGPTKEAQQILASFLEVLILDEGETKLPKEMKSDLERLVLEYAMAKICAFTLQDFVAKSKNLPRKKLFERWVNGGVYGNAFVPVLKRSLELDSNLIYYNFSKISQAQDPDYAQGGLAAVMALFNYYMLKKDEHKKRIVFIADETPFFIQKCFNFFNLSIANIRKEGHGFITVAQKSSHVVVNGDTGILDNSPNKFFFSLDGDEESFKARTQLENEAVDKIKNLVRRNGEFSEVFLKDNKGERVLRIKLSREEYWSYTSKDEDKQKLNEITKACPSLSLEEIIRCLSLS